MKYLIMTTQTLFQECGKKDLSVCVHQILGSLETDLSICRHLRPHTALLCLLSLLLSLVLLPLCLSLLLRHAGVPGSMPSPLALSLLNHLQRRLLLQQRLTRIRRYLDPSPEEERLLEGERKQ